MAVSVPSAKFVSQCLFLLCRLYLGPLFGRSSSVLEKVMFVLLTTVRENGGGVSFILMACAFRSVCLAARELFGIFILA
jgi:hypothetical protein